MMHSKLLKILSKIKNAIFITFIINLLSFSCCYADAYKNLNIAEDATKSLIVTKPHNNKKILDKYYVSAKVGRSINVSLDKGSFTAKPKNEYIFDFEGGYLFNKLLAFGLDFAASTTAKYSSTHDQGAPGSVVADIPHRNTTSFKSQSLIANAYYNILDRDKFIVPYVGAGIGGSRNVMSDYKTYVGDFNGNLTSYFMDQKGSTNIGFAWNLIAGGMINLNKSNNLKLDIQYKYSNLGTARTKSYATYVDNGSVVSNEGTKKTTLKVQSILIGLKYEF